MPSHLVVVVPLALIVGFTLGYSVWRKKKRPQEETPVGEYGGRAICYPDDFTRYNSNAKSDSRTYQDESPQQARTVRSSPPSYSMGVRHRRSRNHDHEKQQYNSEEDAEEVIRRMRMQGKDDEGTLGAYYNHDYCKWFIGNS